MERSRQWAVRCMHEAQMHEKNSFLTLTYATEHLPRDGSLDVRDWQKFAKRTRKKMGPFRFYHCGEYGELNGRPHYHALLFGLDFSEDRKVFKIHRGNNLYRSKLLEDLWPYGHATIGKLTFESAAYVARYVMKKVTGDQASTHYQGKKPEYTTMSRRPGVGTTWYKKYRDETYNWDSVIVNTKETRPPKFYDNMYEIEEPEKYFAITAKRIQAAKKHADNNTPERLEVRERIQEIKSDRYKRDVDKTE